MQPWWKEAVAYQIYPKSFFDSNGDGIGDVGGIIAKLDYLQTLGVNLLWLTPIYQSPDDDNGYDISDYEQIGCQYGTMEEVDTLLRQAHQRGMRVIMDLVINHSSDEHAWFQQSRQSKDNPYRDFYIWRDGQPCDKSETGFKEPTNWGSHFTRSAWSWDEQTEQYYLHLFSNKQPDLNWDNPRVRDALHAMIRRWLDRGIDGFRLDAINFISKRRIEGSDQFPDNQAPAAGDLAGKEFVFSLENFKNGPNFHPYMRELHDKVLKDYDIVTVGECAALSVDDAINISAPERHELNMSFLFEHTDYYNQVGRDTAKLKEILTRWQVKLHNKGWNGIAFNNHDQPRVVSNFADDSPQYRERSAKLMATLLLTLEGTPFIFQGEELGMTNAYFDSIDDYDDVETLNRYQMLLEDGVSPDEAFAKVRINSRDRGRTPMHWNAEQHAGFTMGQPWLKLNPNYKAINAAENLTNPDSVFHYYRRLIELRKSTPALVYGEFIPCAVQESAEDVFIYQRQLGTKQLLVILNLGVNEQVAPMSQGELLVSNISQPRLKTLAAYEARICRIC